MKYYIIAFISILTMIGSFSVNAGSDRNAHVLIFASFSMPKASLEALSFQANQIGAPIIMRGLVNNSFKETVKKLMEFNLEKASGIQIDPLLFKRFDIKKVPAVVVTDNTTCLPQQTCVAKFDVLYGNVPLSYALKAIADKNDTVSSFALDAIQKMQVNHA